MQGTQKAHGFYTMLVVKEYILLEAIVNVYIYMEESNSSHQITSICKRTTLLSIQSLYYKLPSIFRAFSKKKTTFHY